MAQYDSGGFDDFAPPAAGPTSFAPGARVPTAKAQTFERGLRSFPPEWVPDARVTTCMAAACSVAFDTFERRHHCRYCGQIYCERCSSQSMLIPPFWEGRVRYPTRDPQRVCNACAISLEGFQKQWASENANSNRTNSIALEDYSTRYLNSPVRFTLGGEVRKAAYSLRNLSEGINYWDRDSEYFDRQLAGAEGLLFLTVGKIAFIGGVRMGTGLVVARLPDSSWSAPCAVGSFGVTFGAVVGAEVTDFVTPIDSDAVAEFCDTSTYKVSLGGEVSFAFGPLGRTAAGDGIVTSDGSTTSSTSYAQSRGFYGGVTLEGAYLKVRDDVNLKFYGRPLQAADILRGTEKQPTAAAPLYEQLNVFYARMEQRENDRRAAASGLAANPTQPAYQQPFQNNTIPPPSSSSSYQPYPSSSYEPYPSQQPHQQQQKQQHRQQEQPGAVGDSLWGHRQTSKNPFDAPVSVAGRDVVEV